MNETDDELTTLWQSNDTVTREPDMNEIRTNAASFAKKIQRRNMLEVFAAGLVVVFFALRALRAENGFEMIGSGLVVLGALVVAAWVYFRGTAPVALRQESTAQFVASYDAELAYQARLLRRVAVWYIGPLIPGMIVLSIGRVLQDPSLLGVFIEAIVYAFFGLVIWWNARGARKIEAQRERLPELQS